MSSEKPIPLEGSIGPDPGLMADVMNSCNCSHDRAIKLLHWANNDPEKAKHHHRTLAAYMSRSRTSTSQSSTSTTPRSSTDMPQQARETGVLVNARMTKGRGLTVPPPTDGQILNVPIRNGRSLHTPSTDDGSSQSSEFIKPPREKRDESSCEIPQPAGSHFETRLEGGLPTPVETLQTTPKGNIEDSSKERAPQPPRQPEVVEGAQYMQETPVEQEVFQEPEWDFVLPTIPHPLTLTPGNNFDISEIAGAMQYGAPPEMIQNYLGYYDKRTVQKEINEGVQGFPAIFFAVATNNEATIRIWVAHGGDVNSVHGASGVPLLAFAILNSETIQEDTTRTLATLLSLGAIPNCIPAAFYTPFCRDLPDDGPEEQELGDIGEVDKKWCTVSARGRLAKMANLTHRYYLERAAKTKKPSIRHRQIALRRNAEALLGIPYFLIGQTVAANILLQKLLSHILIPGKRPLVLVFAGPSGHGKTELARSLGHLLSLELEVVDCTIFSREQELFGPRAPWAEWEKGSPLNNFLARKAGERCIVFLDEFEKTSRDIHQTLLLPFDSGDYEDRRNRSKIDCSKTIWILATNALDPTIKDFCSQNHDAVFIDDDQDKMASLMKQLSKQIKQEFLRIFDSPLTGRVSSFIPFLPFSPGEQAVVVHKYILELSQKVCTSVNLSPGPNEQLLGNIKLRIRRDASVCKVIADAEYHADLGARSLITAVKGLVEDVLVERYLEVDREIKEGEKVGMLVDINSGEIVVSIVDR
ncbi:Uncharacterized protein BP5553_06358 [Venustampulla echinocandica]|uniref:AAA+ ATPase domain-containing protein n=1 Tax=Venustampulla echinocandica TaxID=2656787 RepID=A0A370TJP8_9HELO|nr:Uncharacterized protein BP5553_06358 [Venustampulla echinocandica]RDL35746.1 Uncharacterized protein BP5553_06358 [Venustampulla echinocandica]